METIVKKIHLYTFDELPDEVQQEAIEKYYEDGDEFITQNDIFLEDVNVCLSSLFTDPEIYYSLSHSQGDGFSFLFETMNSEEIIQFFETLEAMDNNTYWLSNDTKKHIKNYLANINIDKKLIKGLDLSISSYKHDNRYCHIHTIQTEVEDYNYANYNKKTTQYIDDLNRTFRIIYEAICKQLESDGYDFIYYQMSLEEFEEHARANLYLFLEDGSIYSY